MSEQPARPSFFQSRGWRAFRRFFARSYIHAGLTLLAWGTDALPLFFANPARAALVVAVLAQSLVQAWLVYRMPPVPTSPPDFYKPRFQAEIFELIFILTAYSDRHNVFAWVDSLPLRWAGLGLYLLGAGLSIWGMAAWERNQRLAGARASADPALLVTGLYRWVRFPGMTALLLYCLGFALIFRSWVGVAMLLPLLGSLVWRAARDDVEYGDLFPRAWPARMATSKRFIPFVY